MMERSETGSSPLASRSGRNWNGGLQTHFSCIRRATSALSLVCWVLLEHGRSEKMGRPLTNEFCIVCRFNQFFFVRQGSFCCATLASLVLVLCADCGPWKCVVIQGLPYS